MIGDVPIQFIPATTELEKEAIENAIDIDIDYRGSCIKIFTPEYLIAIFLQVFRDKDKFKIMKFLEQAKIDKKHLQNILIRYNLREKFDKFKEKYYE